MELPTVRSYGDALVAAVREGLVAEELVDRALRRVLLQKCELGLLDPDRQLLPAALAGVDPEQARGTVDLDPPGNRALARLLAEQSCVLLANPDGALPLKGTGRIAVVGPRADDPLAMLGCYSFPSHVGVQHPESSMGIDVPTVLEALREEFPGAGIDYAQGCEVDGTDTSGVEEATALAVEAPTSVWPYSATGPACSGAVHRARAATWPTWRCPVSRASSWTRCWRPAPRSSWCC